MHQHGKEHAAHSKQLCIPTVLDKAGRNIDVTGTCASALEQLEECKSEIGGMIDSLDGLLFKPRCMVFESDVREQLAKLAPTFTRLQSLNEEVQALLKNKMRMSKSK